MFARALPVLPQPFAVPPEPGRLDPRNAPAVIEAIRRGAAFAQSRRAAALVTNPMQKETLYAAGFPHPGHTEFLGELAGGVQPVMMLVCDELRVVPVTVHVALKAALAALDTPSIVAAGRIAAQALVRDSASPSRASPSRASTRTPASRRDRPRGDRHHRAGDRRAAARRHRRVRPRSARHAVPRGGAAALRRGAVHVSRPGADPAQDASISARRQCHAGPALHPHLARPRHALDIAGTGTREREEPRRRLEARGACARRAAAPPRLRAERR